MAVETRTDFILYDDRDSEGTNIAGRLQRYLLRQGITFYAHSYADAAALTTHPPRHLILICSPRVQEGSQVKSLIDTMLDQAPERRMGSLVLVRTGSRGALSQTPSLPRRWASIPTYDVGDLHDEDELEKRVWREVQHVKFPYSQAEAARAPASRPRQSAQGRRAMPAYLAPFFIALVLLLIIAATGAIVFKGFALPVAQVSTPGATVRAGNATSTTATKTAASQSTPNAEQRAREQDLATIVKAKPAVSGFQANSGWANNNSTADSACSINNTNYIANIKQTGHYQPCLATGLSYKNFALQVTIDVKGDGGGVIFHSSDAAYYRLSVSQIDPSSSDAPTFALFLCTNGACDDHKVDSGQQLLSLSAASGKGPIQLTLVSHDKNIDIYDNGSFLKRFPETATTGAGQIGVYAADITKDTTATFSNLKIWSLDSK